MEILTLFIYFLILLAVIGIAYIGIIVLYLHGVLGKKEKDKKESDTEESLN